MKYNFENISLKQPQLIFIGSKDKFGAYNKRVFGFHWKSGDNDLYFTKREERLYTELELEVIALDQVINIISELVKSTDEELYFEIFSPNIRHIVSSMPFIDLNLNTLLTNCKVNLKLLERQGIEIKLTNLEEFSPIFESKLAEALNTYSLKNDFQSDTLYLTSVLSKQFDRYLFDLLNDRLIEYISIYEPGVPGVQKRSITPDDESSVNSLLFNIPGNPAKSVNNFKVDQYRRTLMTTRDSDIIIALVNTMNEDNLLFPDSLVYIASIFFNLPIFIFNPKEQLWYTKSISERREIVKAKKLPSFKQYKNVSLYINTYDIDLACDTIKKLIKE